MRLKPLVLLAAAIAAANGAAAAEPATWHVTAQVYSLHEHTTRAKLHNTTPGLGLMRRNDPWLQGAGVFRNSVGRWAGYGYFGWQAPVWRLRAGGIAGLTHNYDFNNRGIVPLGAAVVTVPLTADAALDLVMIPRIENATYNTLNFSFSWRFR